MAVVVKNTFINIAKEPSGSHRRSNSLPMKWKPVPFSAVHSTPTESSTAPPESSCPASPRSDLSFFSACEEADLLRQADCCSSLSCAVMRQPEDNSQRSESGTCCSCLDDVSSETSEWSSAGADATFSGMEFYCPTPTSSLGSPRDLMLGSPRDLMDHFRERRGCLCEEFGGSQMDLVLCYLTNCPCSANLPTCVTPSTREVSEEGHCASTSSEGPEMWSSSVCDFCEPALTSSPQVTETIPEHMQSTRTKLQARAASFQPGVVQQASAPVDARMDTVINAAYLAMTSCGQVGNINLQRDPAGSSPAMIAAELKDGPAAAARCYEVMHLTKQSLDAVAKHLPTIALMSARIQKDESGYSLRANVACLPEGTEDRMCWDLFTNGHCPRRNQCRWYHPVGDDIHRIRVCVRYAEGSSASSSGDEVEEQEMKFSSSSMPQSQKHKISLGELV